MLRALFGPGRERGLEGVIAECTPGSIFDSLRNVALDSVGAPPELGLLGRGLAQEACGLDVPARRDLGRRKTLQGVGDLGSIAEHAKEVVCLLEVATRSVVVLEPEESEAAGVTAKPTPCVLPRSRWNLAKPRARRPPRLIPFETAVARTAQIVHPTGTGVRRAAEPPLGPDQACDARQPPGAYDVRAAST
jgi:hypothetical protein